MTTIAEVKETFETELQAIFFLDQTLAEERSAIKMKAFAEDRPLTDEEVSRRKEIAATRGELAEAMEALALDTVNALENASDVDDLLSNIKAVNQQLKDDLDRFKQLEETAAKAEAVAKGMAGVIEKLLSLKTSLV
jgi:hypothetical protein